MMYMSIILIFLLCSLIEADHGYQRLHMLAHHSTNCSNVTSSTVSSSCTPSKFANSSSGGPYFGLNVVNSVPALGSPSLFKTASDWKVAFSRAKTWLPKLNAVRMYSTTDVQATDNMIVTHLMNALPAAREFNISIFVGLWSGGTWKQDRFYQEAWAFREVLSNYGCDGIAAVSVGNEDLNDVNKISYLNTDTARNNVKQNFTNTLIYQMQQIRDLLKQYGCCNVPVTHTDTYNEWINQGDWTQKLIKACDSFIAANVFPYWGNASSVDDAVKMFQEQSDFTRAVAQKHGKEMWLGETGWPLIDQDQNPHGLASIQNSQKYFDQVGCKVFSDGNNSFYYADWDEDAPNQRKPSFGVMDSGGAAKIKMSC